MERDAAVDAAVVAPLRAEAGEILRVRLSAQILGVMGAVSALEASAASAASMTRASLLDVVARVLAVQDTLGKLMLCLKLGLPSASDRRAGRFGTGIQASLAAELAAVWKACSNFGTLFTGDAQGVLGEEALRHPRVADHRRATEHAADDMRFMATRFLRRIGELLLTLQDILQKNRDRFVISDAAASVAAPPRPFY